MLVNSKSGFTLVELLVSTVLTFFVMGAIYSVFRVQTRSIKSQESRMEAQQYARAVLDLMVREIRNLGYFPTGVPCSPPSNTNGIVAASATSFRFVYDANGTNGCADSDEDINYAFTGQDITRNGVPLTDGNATNLQLTYYPQQTTGIAPAPFCASAGNPSGCSGNLATNLANIQKVSISLTIQSKSPDTEFGGGKLDAIMVSSANLRNRG